MKKVLIMFLAVCMLLSVASCSININLDFDINKKSEGVMTYAQYEAAALDSTVTIETYVQATQSWWKDENKTIGSITCYTCDGEGAYFLYNMPCDEATAKKLVPGTKIRVTGIKSEWSGEVEVTFDADATNVFEILSDMTYVAEPVEISAAQLASADLIKKQNQLASISNLTVVASNEEGAAFLYKWDGSGSHDANSDLYFKVQDENGNEYIFVVESYLCDNTTAVYKAVEELQVGQKINLVGFLYWYNGVQLHTVEVTTVK